jgi:hypothetical protein
MPEGILANLEPEAFHGSNHQARWPPWSPLDTLEMQVVGKVERV